VAPPDGLVDRLARPFEDDLDPAVGQVADPAVDAGALRFVAARLAEPHALDGPRDVHTPADAVATRRPGPGSQTWHASQKNVERPPIR
jgi:hypothetical protein